MSVSEPTRRQLISHPDESIASKTMTTDIDFSIESSSAPFHQPTTKGTSRAGSTFFNRSDSQPISAPSGSESESWQDAESDLEGIGLKFRVRRATGTSRLEEMDSEPDERSPSPGNRIAVPKHRSKTLYSTLNDSKSKITKKAARNFKTSEPIVSNGDDINVVSSMLNKVSLNDNSDQDNGQIQSVGRGRLKKARSKSDTGVSDTKSPFSSYMKKAGIPNYSRKNKIVNFETNGEEHTPGIDQVIVEEEEEEEIPDDIHSDGEIPAGEEGDMIDDLFDSKTSGKKRRFYTAGSSMGEMFHQNVVESPAAMFKRRISAFDTTAAAGNWKDFKNSLRMNFGIKKRKEKEPSSQDYEKSTELITELSAGAPAAIILASSFQRDEKNLKRIPVLMEQIKFKLSDISQNVSEKNRKYRLDLEYGSGPARLTWTLFKEYKDFWLLHTRLKTISFQQGNPFLMKSNRLPKFPTRHRAAGRVQEQRAQNQDQPDTRRLSGPDHQLTWQVSSTSRRPRSTSIFTVSSRSRSASPLSSRRSFTEQVDDDDVLSPVQSRQGGDSDLQKARQYEALAEDMARYLKHIFHLFRFRPEANKIFQFLELSNMSIRLAPEGTFHGKEGYLFTRSSAAVQGWRVSHWRPNDITQMIHRHTLKWFMVRDSYVVCVENIYETNVLEVFLVDAGFKATHRTLTSDRTEEEPSTEWPASQVHITLQLENMERRIKLVTGSERSLSLWMDSINEMKEHTIWSKSHRFDSFAPVRNNVHAQWFVDGRDYFWAVSSAIDMAKDVIYIHDWWLSPELYLRRPPEGNQEWRLDRLLQRKAKEGVKIFVIVYRNVGQIIPIDSFYTKHSLLDLHKNIYVMRSPNQWVQNTYFWAHHEKLCLVDHTIAFLGGIDLCYGRYDTPDHVLADDSKLAFYNQASNPRTANREETQIWPGKDYSNPRVQDFSNLDHPYEDMYDRQSVPRMPWHDIHMMVTGQPARDLVRHFVQRWNYMIRQKRPSRHTPLLLPPSDFTDEQVRDLNLDGSCEVQLLRSACNWSLGTLETECSIQNAYLKVIEQSEHFVYIENQFFITSTSIESTLIENRIGDALVERIIRAHDNQENWRAVIVIPLMPGFESRVDLPDGSSVRMIMQCQYFTISRGPNSLFAKLEKHGINPDDYIQFFSLRKWGKIGANKKLVTEQLYVHAKTMIVDDRIAIIGSANINERSMRGSRDSEVAAIIRDSHQIDSKMGGEPFKVGKFAHSLRIRLMREHLGVDVDKLDLIERQMEELANGSDKSRREPSLQNGSMTDEKMDTVELRSFNHFAGIDNIGLREKKAFSSDSRVQGNVKHRQDVLGEGFDGMLKAEKQKELLRQREQVKQKKGADVEEIQEMDSIIEYTESSFAEILDSGVEDVSQLKSQVYERVMKHREDDGHVVNESRKSEENDTNNGSNSDDESEDDFMSAKMTSTIPVDPFKFEDPLDDSFYYDTWLKIAERNTLLFREVFRCQPDDEVTTWKEYKEYVAYGERFSRMQDEAAGNVWPEGEALKKTTAAHAPLGVVEDGEGQSQQPGQDATKIRHPVGIDVGSLERRQSEFEESRDPHKREPRFNNNERFDYSRSYQESTATNAKLASASSLPHLQQPHSETSTSYLRHQQSAPTNINKSRRRRANTRSSRRWMSMDRIHDMHTVERMLQGIQGHLVLFPCDWLARELEMGNWFYNLDRIPPLEIYD